MQRRQTTVRQVLQHVCELLDWDFGAVWVLLPTIVMRFSRLVVWQKPCLDDADFVFAIRRFRFFSGQGLPGRVWETRQATWIEDVLKDPNFSRAKGAPRAAAQRLCVPVQFQDEFHGVVEFFSREIREPDQGLLDSDGIAWSQLGNSPA